MKITSSTPRSPLATEASATRAPLAASTGDARATAGAQVALSPTSRALSALSDGSNDIDMARVSAIRDAIASGQLKIDTSRIADGLIASARDLLK